ncbi:hypothetical protein E2I00_010653, partial [Balaenoptera physalus]
MDAPASSPRSRILGHSSMFRFFRSLVGSKGSPKSSDKPLLGGQSCPFREQDATPLMTDRQGGAGRKESRPPATLPYTLSVALPQPDPSGLGLGDTGAQTPTAVEVLRVLAQGVEVKPVLPRGSQEVLGNLSELEEREEEEEEAAGDTGTSDSDRYRSTGDLRLASSQVGATPWNRLLSLYKQLQKSATAKGLDGEGAQLGVTRGCTGLGFVESELKKLLVVQRESRLWKMGGHEGRKLLTQPEITLEEAGIVDG